MRSTTISTPRKKSAHSSEGMTRSPADQDIFHDDGPKVPVKDWPAEERSRTAESSEAGGVD